ncbi:MAG: Bax inhibitor-1/YccA family protein [Alphaproteobacteria bacterium]|nr:Bax inhibitor-1/YccA family protein [Alphaproteobacteria bacterium]
MSESEQIVRKSAIERVDDGLRQYMIKVFNYMGLGLVVTTLAAYITFYTPVITWMFSVDQAAQTISLSAFGWIVTLAPLAMIFGFNAILAKGSMGAAQAMFWAFSVVMGMSLADIGLLYTGDSIVRVFLITAATFGGMSLLGYTTKIDLTRVGTFMYMGLWGIIIASIVNIFLKSSGLYYAISYIAVLVFTVLTAYDVQAIKNMYYASDDEDSMSRKAISGAMNLYLDFINLFLYLMRILGDRK